MNDLGHAIFPATTRALKHLLVLFPRVRVPGVDPSVPLKMGPQESIGLCPTFKATLEGSGTHMNHAHWLGRTSSPTSYCNTHCLPSLSLPIVSFINLLSYWSYGPLKFPVPS